MLPAPQKSSSRLTTVLLIVLALAVLIIVILTITAILSGPPSLQGERVSGLSAAGQQEHRRYPSDTTCKNNRFPSPAWRGHGSVQHESISGLGACDEQTITLYLSDLQEGTAGQHSSGALAAGDALHEGALVRAGAGGTGLCAGAVAVLAQA